VNMALDNLFDAASGGTWMNHRIDRNS